MSRLRLVRDRETDDDDADVTIDDIMLGPSPAQVAAALRAGRVPSERSFDRFLPYELRIVSGQYWTPLSVAVRVAEWLNQHEVQTVVDIGSGAGKLCVVAALATRCHFIGIEQRPRLIAAARELAELFGVEQRVHFIHRALTRDTVFRADAFYMYNPFGENLFGPSEHLDEDVELGQARYLHDVACVEHMLARAPVGTYLVKYNGFGGQVPASYRLLHTDLDQPNVLRLWQKSHAMRLDDSDPG